MLGLPTHSQAGEPLYTAHFLRVGGAQFLAGLGFDILLIKLLFRWMSVVVMRYIAEHPLRALTNTYRRLKNQNVQLSLVRSIEGGASSSSSSGARDDTAHQRIDKLRDLVKAANMATRDHLVSVEQDLEAARESAAKEDTSMERRCIELVREEIRHHDVRPATVNDKYIKNLVTGAVHRVLVMSTEVHHKDWVTCCGWPFSSQAYEILEELGGPWRSWCGGPCLKLEKEIARNEEMGRAQVSDDSSSNESSSPSSEESDA